jgi:site-specific DNA-methyltransferase (adenine-specific)
VALRLGHVIDREKADIGVLIVMDKPTGPMKEEAAAKGAYKSEFIGRSYPRIQIFTVEDLFAGKRPGIPGVVSSIKKDRAVPVATGEFDL